MLMQALVEAFYACFIGLLICGCHDIGVVPHDGYAICIGCPNSGGA
jgi:hypothetical protein